MPGVGLGGVRLIGSDDNSYSYIAGGATNQLLLNPGGGNVGIGATSPQALLHVGNSSGEIRIGSNFGSTSTSAGKVSFVNTSGGTFEMASIDAASDSLSGNYGDLLFKTGQAVASGTEKMRITSAGNVGIGTTTPSNLGAYQVPLTVTGSSYNFVRLIANGAGTPNTGIIYDKNDGTGTGFLTALNNSSDFRFAPMATMDQTGLTNAKDGSAGLTIKTGTGNVGIGLTNPSYTLDVSGDVNASGCVRAGGATLGGTCSSDERLKSEIQPFNLGLDALLGMSPKTFKYNGLGGHPASDQPELGVIAQEIEKALNSN